MVNAGSSYMSGAGSLASAGYSGSKCGGSGYSGGKYSGGVNYSGGKYGLGNYGKGFSFETSVKLPSLASLYKGLLDSHILPEGSMGIKELKAYSPAYKTLSDYLEGVIKASFSKSVVKDSSIALPIKGEALDLGSLLKQYKVLDEPKVKVNPYNVLESRLAPAMC